MKCGFIKCICLILFTVSIVFSSDTRAVTSELTKYTELPVQISNKVINASLMSTVKVMQPKSQSYGSGAYLIIDDKYVILTAAHVVGELKVLSVQNGYEVVPGTVIYKDDELDIAFLLVPKMRSREPIKFKLSENKKLGDPVLYSGYPNNHDLLLFFGRIAGKEANVIFMHSYAWMGSSGSVVLDLKGNIVGVLSAVDVGHAFGPQIVEDLVWVSRIDRIDFEKLKVAVSGGD